MLYCSKCQYHTESIEPVMIRRQDHTRFHVRALCSICDWTKGKYFSNSELSVLPEVFWKLPIGHNFMKYIVHNNKKIEIFPIVYDIINS